MPRYLHPRDVPSDAAGTVFRTIHNGEETEWLVLRYSPADGVAEYVRITPGSRMGLVTVRATERGGGTDVEVTYRMTSLSDAGTTDARGDDGGVVRGDARVNGNG